MSKLRLFDLNYCVLFGDLRIVNFVVRELILGTLRRACITLANVAPDRA